MYVASKISYEKNNNNVVYKWCNNFVQLMLRPTMIFYFFFQIYGKIFFTQFYVCAYVGKINTSMHIFLNYRMQPPSSAVSSLSFRPSVMRRVSNTGHDDLTLQQGLNNLKIRNEWGATSQDRTPTSAKSLTNQKESGGGRSASYSLRGSFVFATTSSRLVSRKKTL